MGRRNVTTSSRHNISTTAVSFRTYDEAVQHFSKNDRSKVLEMKVPSPLTLSWNCDGTRLASGAEKSVAVATFDSSHHIKDLFLGFGHSEQVDHVAFHPNNTNILASASSDRTIRLWDIRQTLTHTKMPTKSQNLNVTWSPCGTYFLYGDKDDNISMMDSRSLKTIRVESLREETNEFAFEPSGKYLFVTHGGGRFSVYRMPEMERIRSIQAHSPQSTCVCVSVAPNGEFFAVGASDALCSIWDSKQLICCTTLGRLDYPLRSISFSVNSNLIATASEDQFIDIAWAETGERVYELRVNAETFTCAWHPHEYLLAYASASANDSRDRDVSVKLFGFTMWINVCYFIWYAYDFRSPGRGGHPKMWFRNFFLWKYMAAYFPMKLYKTADLPSGHNYIIGTHPHGLTFISSFVTYCTNATGFSNKYPGLFSYLAALPSGFLIPYRREYLLTTGLVSCRKPSLEYLLNCKKDVAVAINIGAGDEVIFALKDDYHIVLKNKKGFVKLALQAGSALVPSFSFGEIETYKKISIFNKIPFVVGEVLLNIIPTFVARRVPINTIIGKPIFVEKEPNPTIEQIDALHEQYCNDLRCLFDTYKSKLGIPKDKKLVIR
uniref:WD_REPEATS_REGION domain-containing protein n=1 Tax=Syphacia muris TaxID=451379 RepID=A0A158R443_9BILA